MKNITFLIGGLSSGGAEHQLSELCNMLVDKYKITIATWVDFDDHYKLDSKIERVRIAPHKNRCIKIFSVMWYFLRCKSDVVISYTAYDSILALIPLFFRRGVKSIVSERNYKDLEGTFVEFILYRLLYRRATYIVPNSYAQGRYICEKTKYRNKVRPITNYTDVSKYKLSPMAEHRPIIIGVFSRYAQQKNYIRFAQAIAIVKKKISIPFDIDWYGKKYVFNTVNKNFEEFQAIVDKLSLSDTIHLHDHISNVAERIRDFDVICLMSLREGFSNAISEAICSGRPVIASNVSDNSLMVKDGVNGFLIDPYNVDSMAEGIIKFLNLSFEKRQNMGMQSRYIAERLFDEVEFKGKYINLIEN